MSVQILQEIAQTRRSLYVLNKDLPISQDEVKQIVEHALKHTPSSFNSQSTRMVVLFGAEHEKLWDIAISELRKIVPADKFEPTENKLNMFKAAAGSVLFFEDQEYAIWTTLSAAAVGANLQHYNPVIDAEVAKTWNIPANWTLRAQLIFGGMGAPAGEKSFASIEERMKVFGA